MFNKTMELHEQIIRYGIISAKDKVLYASTGISEYAYNKYPSNVIGVVEPNPMFDTEKWEVANYCHQECPIFENITDAPSEYIKRAVAIIHNYPQFGNYDYTNESILWKGGLVVASFFPTEAESEMKEMKKLFGNVKCIGSDIYISEC